MFIFPETNRKIKTDLIVLETWGKNIYVYIFFKKNGAKQIV